MCTRGRVLDKTGQYTRVLYTYIANGFKPEFTDCSYRKCKSQIFNLLKLKSPLKNGSRLNRKTKTNVMTYVVQREFYIKPKVAGMFKTYCSPVIYTIREV